MENRDKSYRTIALNTFLEFLKIIIVLLSSFIVISIVFDLSSSNFFTFLGAIMAVIILVFRDPVLGFVAGINIANSKQLKSGDEIYISKYNLEGIILEINLVTTKIQNKDKTISTIPTYDLISTEVINYEPMKSSHSRRIKRSIIIDSQSVLFLEKKELDEMKINETLHQYFTSQKTENDLIQTNLGLFRNYIKWNLQNHLLISKKDTLMVRLLDPTIYGIPIEVYCFTNTSDLLEFEDIQAEIFEHIISISTLFGLKTVAGVTS